MSKILRDRTHRSDEHGPPLPTYPCPRFDPGPSLKWWGWQPWQPWSVVEWCGHQIEGPGPDVGRANPKGQPQEGGPSARAIAGCVGYPTDPVIIPVIRDDGEALIVDATQDSTEPGDDSGSIIAPLDTLLAELDPTTDLARLVERIARNGLPWVVVPTAALTAWEQRDPAGWAKVSAWLGAKGIAIVRI